MVGNIVHEDHKWVFLADLSTSSYVLMLERWMLPLSYIQRPTTLLVWTIRCEDCPYVRVLNATTFVRSTPNNSIGKDHYVWRLQMSYLADLSTTPYVLMLERWMLPFSYIQRPTLLLVRNFEHEDHKWVFLADLSTSSYVLMLERWMLPLSYVQRTTIVLVRTIMCEDCK